MKTAFVGDGRRPVLVLRIDRINRTVPWDGVMNVSERGYFKEWVSIPLGTVATRIASKRFDGHVFYRVMLPDGREVITSMVEWEPVK